MTILTTSTSVFNISRKILLFSWTKYDIQNLPTACQEKKGLFAKLDALISNRAQTELLERKIGGATVGHLQRTFFATF